MPSRRTRKRYRRSAGQAIGAEAAERGDRESPPLQESRGALGGGCLHPGKANLRLIGCAIRHDWPLPPEMRQALVHHLIGVMRTRKARNTLAAARCAVAAEQANLKTLANRDRK